MINLCINSRMAGWLECPTSFFQGCGPPFTIAIIKTLSKNIYNMNIKYVLNIDKYVYHILY